MFLFIFQEKSKSKIIPAKVISVGDKLTEDIKVNDIIWWETYPGTDKFEYKGKSFSATRALRANKDECRTKFNKILLEGDYTSEQLVEALKYDVQSKKENSISTGTNKLSFMQNSLTYLNQRSYEPFIELINEGVELNSSPQSGIDI